MKSKLMLCGLSVLFMTTVAHATPTLTVGQPGDSLLSTPSKPSINLGGTTLNFDSLAPNATYSTYSASGVSISSPDGLVVLPYSTQSGPNELYDNSSDGSASILISLTQGVTGIGFGIADSDPVSIMVQAIGAGGIALGSPFLESLLTTESLVNTGNGYYAVRDTTADIFGLRITEAAGDPNYSGLALDDVQVAPVPEPSSFLLLAEGIGGIVALRSFRRFKRS